MYEDVNSLLSKGRYDGGRFCEYLNPVELDDDSKYYITIPHSLIIPDESVVKNVDKAVVKKSLTVFSHMYVRKGGDNKVLFSVNHIVEQLGLVPNRTANGINAKILCAIDFLRDKGYISIDDIPNSRKLVYAKFNAKAVADEIHGENRFAIIYVDELEKIMSYRFSNKQNTYSTNIDSLLLVFAYLRMMIYRRRNEFLPGEGNIDGKDSRDNDIVARRLRSPDVYDCFYGDIADDLGLSARVVSEAVDILRDELHLIYYEALPRFKYKDENGEVRWRTDCTLFCNTYKREGAFLLASGTEYYESEIENKKRKLAKLGGFKNM